MKYKILHCFIITLSCVYVHAMNFLEQNPQYQSYVKQAKLYDYIQDSKAIKHLKRKWNKKKDIRIRIFGDSHIAGDFISNELRTILGNINAVGFAYPLMPPYHQTLMLDYKSENFDVLDSRKKQYDIPYPMGGVIALPNTLPAFIQISINPKQIHTDETLFTTYIVFKNSEPTPAFLVEDSKQKKYVIQTSQMQHWEIMQLSLSFPITIHAMNDKAMLGGYFIYQRKDNNIVEHLGINGVRSDIWLKWDNAILQEELGLFDYDIIILCYGSNDAMFNTINKEKFIANYHSFITMLKEKNPNALIVFMSPPPVLVPVGSSKNRYQLSPTFHVVKEAMRKVAQTEHALFFDIDEFITSTGGKATWIKHGLSKKDVHLLPSGYKLIAHGFYYSLQNFLDSY